MQNSQIFKFIFDSVETPFLDNVTQMVAALIAYAAAPLQTALVLYVALTGILILRGQGGTSIGDLTGRIIKLSLVAWFATNGVLYTIWVQNFFMTVLPNDITAAISSAGTGNPNVNANSFDLVWGQAYESGLRVWRLLDYWDVGEEITIFAYWVVAIIACVIAFTIWFLSHVVLGLFIIIGPLMIGLVLFPATSTIFERWIGAMISCVVLQVLTVILLSLTLRVEGQIVQLILVYKGPNVFEQIRTLMSGMIFFVFSGIIAFQLPGVANALAGGVHFHTAALARGAMRGGGRIGRAVGSVGGAANAGIDRGVAGLRQRIGPPTGNSLSRTPSTTPATRS